MENSKNNLEIFFNPRSIAVVGATEKEGKVGNAVAKNLLQLGYEGDVFLVNPGYKELFGKRCYAKLEDIEAEIDLAVIIVPAKFVNGVIQNAAEKVKNFIVISAGFLEIGGEGEKREKELARIAEEKKLNILGPNCLGFIRPGLKLNASFAGGLPAAGNVAFVSQSGALAVALMDMAEEKGIAFSHLVSIGNEMQIDGAALIEYLGQDENTKIIGMYLEGIKDGARLIKAAREVSRKKPIIVLKAGKTEKSQKAISSHTGALAGSDEIISAVFAKTGILRADSLEELISLVEFLSVNREPENDLATVITNAGGAGVLITDAFQGKQVKLADIDEQTKDELRKFLPEESALENPIDLLGDAGEDRYEKVLNIIDKTKTGSIICALTPQDQTPVAKIADKIIEFKKKTGKLVTTIFVGGTRTREAVLNLKAHNISNFTFPQPAADAIDQYYQWKVFKKRKTFAEAVIIDEKRKEKVEEIIGKAKAEKRPALLFSEAKEIMEAYGINTAAFQGIGPGESLEKEIGFPVVVKIDSDKILHKTDKQGIILNVGNQRDLEKALEKMKINFPGEHIIVQPMLDVQIELIMGIKRDEIFGPVVVLGLGGIYTEVFKLADFIIPPVTLEEIKEILAEKSKLSFLFKGTRGQQPYNLEELAKNLFNLAALAQEVEAIKELDVNPLLIYNDKRKAVAVDVKIILDS